jgi:hypothetical protein
MTRFEFVLHALKNGADLSKVSFYWDHWQQFTQSPMSWPGSDLKTCLLPLESPARPERPSGDEKPESPSRPGNVFSR